MADQHQGQQPRQAPAPTPAPAPVVPTTSQDVTALLAATLAQLAEANKQNQEANQRIAALLEEQAKYNKAALRIAPRRRKSMAEYLAETKARRKYLKHEVYQNGRLVNPKGLSQDTLDVLDTLNTGDYCDNMVNVVRVNDGPEGRNSRIHLRYNNGTIEERMVFYMRFPTFTKIVQDIAAEMKQRNIPFVSQPGQDPPEFEFPDELKELL